MFKNPGRIVYRVSDLEKAKEWYRQVLGADPVIDSPVGVVFAIGESVLILETVAGSSNEDDGPFVFWVVDDAVSSHRRLCDLGAVTHTDLKTMFGIRSGTVTDPFGNVIGVLSKVDTAKKTVEQKPSDTARGVAALRFVGTLEEREEIKCHDSLSEIFLAEEVRTALRDPAKREWFLTKFVPAGQYRFAIARTVWFDGLVEEALKTHIPQIVFLGAGYDSRPYRFADLIWGTRIFEVDAPPTQEFKRSLLAKAGVAIPEDIAFVPVDFTRDSLKDALLSAGFDAHQKTLFVWEGVIQYLPAQAIDETLGFIRKNSLPGSAVCFDYPCTFEGEDEAYGVKEQREFMRGNAAGEPVVFRIARGQISTFLSERGFNLTEHLTAEDMERRYLVLKNGSSAGKVTATCCLALAKVV